MRFFRLHHPNNSFENISIFYFSLFNSVAKELLLGRKNIGGAVDPPCTAEVMPVAV
jgi:hypothetical protein